MKKFLCLLSAMILFTFTCLVSCDTECSSTTSSQSQKKTNNNSSTVKVATLEVTVNVTEVTIDDIFQIQLNFNTGSKNNFANSWDFTKKIGKDKMKITKTGNREGTIKFTLEDNDLVDDFTPYYMITIIDSAKTKLGNLKEIYQDSVCFTTKTKHSITLTVDGLYADQGVILQ